MGLVTALARLLDHRGVTALARLLDHRGVTALARLLDHRGVTALARLLDHRGRAVGRGGRAATVTRPAAVGLAAIAVLLTACGDGNSTAACKVDVDTPDLVQAREAAHIEDCPSVWTAVEGPKAQLPDIEIPCLGSTTRMRLSDLRGPAIVNFWSTTCGPCRTEMPALQAFDRQYGDKVLLLGVNFLDTYPGAAIDFARIKGVTYPSAADPCGALQATDLVLQGLPQFLFVKADGSVEQQTGGVDSVAEIKDLAEKNLGITL